MAAAAGIYRIGVMHAPGKHRFSLIERSTGAMLR
jgi:hypothetical protein